MEIYILWINFFFPTFNKYIGANVGSIIFTIVLIFLSLIVFFIKKNVLKKEFYILMIFNIIMITMSILFNIKNVVIRDFYEYQKPLLIFLSMLIGYNYSLNIDKFSKKLENLFDVFLYVNALKLLFPKIYFFQLYQRINLSNQSRFTGTFISPYDYAYFLIFPFFYYLDKGVKTKKLKNILKALLMLISIIFTQSRSQLITLSIGIIVYIFFNIFIIKENLSFLYKIIFLKVIVIIIFLTKYMNMIQNKLEYLIKGVLNILNNGFLSDPSSRIRFEQILYGVTQFYNSKFYIGYGPNKQGGELFENYYVLYLFRYGIGGIIYNLILFVILFKSIRSSFDKTKSLSIAYSIWIIILPIALLPNNTIDQIRISYFFFFIVGFFLKKNKNS